jgi:hypothetical protein
MALRGLKHKLTSFDSDAASSASVTNVSGRSICAKEMLRPLMAEPRGRFAYSLARVFGT